MNKALDIGVDFDGTLCLHRFPKIGEEVPYAFDVLKRLQAEGHRLRLWTMRSDIPGHADEQTLTEAINWCKDRGITFVSHNVNHEQAGWTLSPKMYCNLYIDDAAVGCPLIHEHQGVQLDRPYVDWFRIATMLKLKGVLPSRGTDE